MWCSICRQDVPGSIIPGGGQYCCPRCGEGLSTLGGSSTVSQAGRETGHPDRGQPGPAPASDYDEWEMEERLRHLDRIYARPPLDGPLTRSGGAEFRIDAAHPSVPHRPPPAASSARGASSWVTGLGRLVLAFGLATAVCGGCLVAWSHFGARPELMPLGIPIAIVGQVLLLLGLVLQFDGSSGEARPRLKRRSDPAALRLGDTNFRVDAPRDGSPQLDDLAARLEELSKRLEHRDERE